MCPHCCYVYVIILMSSMTLNHWSSMTKSLWPIILPYTICLRPSAKPEMRQGVEPVISVSHTSTLSAGSAFLLTRWMPLSLSSHKMKAVLSLRGWGSPVCRLVFSAQAVVMMLRSEWKFLFPNKVPEACQCATIQGLKETVLSKWADLYSSGTFVLYCYLD